MQRRTFLAATSSVFSSGCVSVNKPPAMAITISLAEAIDRYALKDYVGLGLRGLEVFDEVESQKVRVYQPGSVIDEVVVLNELVHQEKVAGIIALGDLRMSKSLVDFESDTLSSFVLVQGNLQVVNLVCGCAEVVVRGDVQAQGVVMSYYNHGRMRIGGNVQARLLAVDDHDTEVSGIVNAATLGSGPTVTHWDFSKWPEVLSEKANAALFREDGSWLHGNESALIAHLALGRQEALLKPGIGRRS
jgi:hypothetical protein